MDNDYYITIFSRKLFIELKKKNIFPFSIEPNKKFPKYQVYKYKDDDRVRKILEDYKKGGK